MKKCFVAIHGGAKVFGHSKIPRRGLLPVLILLMSLITTSAAFAQGSIFGTVTNSDASVPANGEISFIGYLDNTDEEIRLETSVGAGYDGGNWYDDFQNYLTEAPGNPYDYHFYNSAMGQGFVLSKPIPNNSFQQENIVLTPVSWPGAPTGLIGRTISSSSVVISWEYFPGLTYHVYRRMASSNGSFFRIDDPGGSLANPGVSVRYFVDTGVDGVSSYHYLVIAEDASGNLSPHSAILTVNSAAIQAPVIATITPNSGYNMGGEPVTIDGLGFDMAGVTASINGIPLTSAVVVSPFQITGLTPPGSPGPADVVAINNASGLASAPLVGGYTYLSNNPPVLDSVGPQTVAEGANLNLTVTASDPDLTIPVLSTSTLPTNATFVDNLDGTGTFDFNPDYTQEGIYPVTFYASDGIVTDSEVVSITVTHTNQSPILAPIGPQAVVEGGNLNFGISATDADGEIPALTTSALPTNGTFLDNGDGTGTFDFNPDLTQEGAYPITFYASDGIATDSEVVTVTVTHTNQDPVLDPIGPQTVAEGANLNFVTTSSDADGEIPSLSTSTLPTNATFVDNLDGTGTFDFNPDYTQEGIFPVTFYASDGIATDSEVVSITVTHTNQDPVLAPIGPQTVAEGGNLNLGITASDADGEIPTLTTSALPTNATFLDNGDGTATFDFNPDFTQEGAYPVTFYASDGIAADSEVVTVTVTHTNQDPVLDPIGDRSVIEGGNLNFAVTSSDADGEIPAIATSALPANATFVDNLDGTGTFDFNPDFTQEGAYPVTFYATDGVATDSEVVTITVQGTNLDPVLDPIGPQTVAEGASLNLIVTASDPDSTIPALTTSTLPVNATFLDNGDGTGTLDFNPDFTQEGGYPVTFYASDGIATDSELVTITVTHTNQAPVLDSIGSQLVDEGANLNFMATASDADGEIPAISTSTLPANATFLDNGDGTGTFDFNPDFTQGGTSYDVTFYATDGVATDSEVVTISINEAGNQAPVLDPIGPQSVDENANINLVVTASDPDAETPVLTAENIPTGATFLDNLDGTGTFDFTPDFTQAGDYNITFIASDGILADSEVVVLSVIDVNRPPVIDPIGPQTVDEGANLNFAVSASDPDGTIPVLTTSTLPANATFLDNGDGTGVFDFNPDFAQGGDHFVTFYANDGIDIDSQTVTITVIDAGNQPPVLDSIGDQIVYESLNLNLIVTASDPDGDIPTMSATGLPLNATFVDNLDGTGTFDFTPDYDQTGNHLITFKAFDGIAVDSEVVTVTVLNTNRPPVLAAIGDQSMTEGDSLHLVVSGSDPDGQIPTLSTSALPANAVFVDNNNGTGSFDFVPDFTQNGVFDIVFYASDGVAIDSELIFVTVGDAGNQAPVLDSIGPRIVGEGVLLTINVTAADPDGLPPTLSAINMPLNATFADNLDGTGLFQFTPDFTQAGTYGVTFIASDGILSDSEMVLITVQELGNQAPIFDPVDPQTMYEGDTLIIDFSATDPEGDNISFNYSSTPSVTGITLVDNLDGTGTMTFIPDYSMAGLITIRIFATDDGTPPLTGVLPIAVTVMDVNQPPQIDSLGPFGIRVGKTLQFTVTAHDSTAAPGGSIYLTTGPLPGNSSFTDNGNGTGLFSFSPDISQVGVDTVRFIAIDDGVPPMSDQIDVEITIVADNQPPVLADPGPQMVLEGETVTFTVTATDADGTTPILWASDLPANATFDDNGNGSGTFDFAPGFTQSGLYGVVIRASDGIDVDRITVLVQVVDAGNQIPEMWFIGPQQITEKESLSLAIQGTDPDSTIPALFADPLPPGATFVDNGDGTGQFDWTPGWTQSGNYQVNFIADDGELADTELVDIDVLPGPNQPPSITTENLELTIDELQEMYFDVTTSDSDGVAPILTTSALPGAATFTDNQDFSGEFRWQTTQDDQGVHYVTVYATDADSADMVDSVTVTITVNDINRLPRWSGFPIAVDMNEGDTVVALISAIDDDGTIPILGITPQIPNFTFYDSGNGNATLTITPDYTQGTPSGRIYYIYRYARDGDTLNYPDDMIEDSLQSNSVKIFDVPVPPVLNPIGPQTVMEGQTLSFEVDGYHPGGLAFDINAENMPENSSLQGFGHPKAFYFTPSYTQAGVYDVTFIAVDNNDMSDSEVVTITVTEAGNQAPYFEETFPDTQIVTYGESVINHIVAVDPDADPLTLSLISPPANAVFVDSANNAGSMTFVPDNSQIWGIYLFRYVATDPSAEVDTMFKWVRVVAFMRGDSNNDGAVDIGDISFLISYIFRHGPAPASEEAADVNSDSSVDVSDALYLVNFIFRHGPPPPN